MFEGLTFTIIPVNLPTRQKTSAIERAGVNHVRTIVEEQNCIFHEIHHENDFGNDAFIELVDGDQVTGVCVGVQIKSGDSYCTRTHCRIPFTDKQAKYWSQHSLPILGIVYDPTENAAFWVDIVTRSRKALPANAVTFEKTELRRFNGENVRDLLLPKFIGKRVRLSFERAQQYAYSLEPEAHSIGLRALLAGHHDTLETWHTFAHLLSSRKSSELDPFIVYAFAHIPWHGDIAGPQIVEHVRKDVGVQLTSWGRAEVEKLLELMDENGVERGSIGQSVYAIVDLALPQSEQMLLQILWDGNADEETRRKALYLFAFVAQKGATAILEQAVSDSVIGPLAVQMLDHLKKVGFFSV